MKRSPTDKKHKIMKLFGKNKYEKRKNILIIFFIIFLFIVFLFFFNNIRNGVIRAFYLVDILVNNQEEALKIENSILQNQITDLLYKNELLKNNIILNNSSQVGEFLLLKSIVSENFFYNSLILRVYNYKDQIVLDKIKSGDVIYIKGLYPVGILEILDKNVKDIIRLKLFSHKDFSFTVLLEDYGSHNFENSQSQIPQQLSTSSNLIVSYNDIKIEKRLIDDRLFYSVGAVGDGMYGIYAYIPKDKKVTIGQKVYYKENIQRELGVVSSIDFIEKENLQKVYIKTYYKDNQDSSFFIKI